MWTPFVEKFLVAEPWSITGACLKTGGFVWTLLFEALERLLGGNSARTKQRYPRLCIHAGDWRHCRA
jgi:hypothetical protein